MPRDLAKVFLLELQLARQIEQAHLLLLLRHHFVEEGEVIAEEHDRAGIGDRLFFAEEVLEEDRRHRRDVLVAEAQIGARETGIARLNGLDANLVGAVQHVAREDLLGDGHRPRLGRDRRQEGLALHARDVEREQAAVLDYLARDLVFAFGELHQRNLFSGANPVDHAEVGGGQHAEVLAVLLVDALDVLGDHQLDAGRHLGIRRLLAAGTFAAALAADSGHKAARLDGATRDWGLSCHTSGRCTETRPVSRRRRSRCARA